MDFLNSGDIHGMDNSERSIEEMGRFVNPDNSAFQVALNSEIYVDKTRLIEYTNSVLGITFCQTFYISNNLCCFLISSICFSFNSASSAYRDHLFTA